MFELAPASDYCLRWAGRRHSWRHTSEGGFDPSRYNIGPLGEAQARAFVEANHYSHSYPAARLRYGLWYGPWVVGVAVLSVPMQAAVLTSVFPDLEPTWETLELGRFVLADTVPAPGESWFLARVFEYAARSGLRGVVSFSDPLARTAADGRVMFRGHVGLIYQASNALYLGRTTPRTLHVLPNGEVLSARTAQKIRSGDRGWGYAEAQLVAAGVRPRRLHESPRTWLASALRQATRLVRHPGNHRYAFRIGPWRRLIHIALEARPAPCPCAPCQQAGRNLPLPPR